MAVSINVLRSVLSSDEPDYEGLRRLGPSLIPQLQQLVRDRSAYVAANAASLAGMIGGARAAAVLQQAGRSPSADVRIAAAGGLRHLRGANISGLLASLSRDRDPDVRTFALKASRRAGPAIAARAGAPAPGRPRQA